LTKSDFPSECRETSRTAASAPAWLEEAARIILDEPVLDSADAGSASRRSAFVYPH